MLRVMRTVDTIATLLAHRAQSTTSSAGYHVLHTGEVDGERSFCSWADLHARSCAVATGLQERGVRHDGHGPRPRVLVMCAPGIDFITAWCGVVLAGAIAVPVFPPDAGRVAVSQERLRAVIADCAPSAIVADAFIIELCSGLVPDAEALPWFAVDALATSNAAHWRDPGLVDADVAFLQYTSGSTGTPRGVCVSHKNLLANLQQIQTAMALTTESVGVIWLPPYHDMGLIGGILQPLFADFPVHLFSPLDFLQRPLRWLQAVSATRATISGGPNFAWDLCVRRFLELPEHKRPTLDLSSWRVAFNGAEPVRAATLSRFASTFADVGFSSRAWFPCYGLAEATLLVSGDSDGAKTLRVAPDRLGRNEAVVVVGEGGGSTSIVGSGRVGAGIDVQIVNADGVPVAARVVGEVTVRGDNVCAGTFSLAQTTPLPTTNDGALRTGDLGFLDDDGTLFVTGRIKDMIIVRGHNHYPHDLEATVEGAHAAVRRGSACAFADVDHEGNESLGIALEVGAIDDDTAQAIVSALQTALATRHGVSPTRIALCPPQAVPKTSSGKLQRSACRAGLVDDTLPCVLHWRSTAGAAPADSDVGEDLYVDLLPRFARLDRRHTRYRYDEERDIRWDAFAAPGVYAGKGIFTAHRLDVDQFAAHPQALETLQWVLATSACDVFVALEEAVLRFSAGQRASLGPTRSLDMLDEEEAKHVRTFRRLSTMLRALHPEHVPAMDEQRATTQRFYDRTVAFGQGSEKNPARAHFMMWVTVLFFEEYTIYFDHLLSQEAPGTIQPTWADAHRAHAQEEQQHVVTDAAYLACLQASDEERYAWSREVFEDLLKNFTSMFMPWLPALLRIDPSLEPLLAAANMSAVDDEPLMFSLLRNPHFSQTVAAAPWLAHMLATRGAAAPSSSSTTIGMTIGTTLGTTSAPALQARAAELSDWIADHVARLVGGVVDRQRTFAELGMDSLQVVGLAGDLQTHTGCTLSATAAYDHPTVALLAAHVVGLDSTVEAVPPVVRPGPLPLSWRQRRLVALDAAHPGALFDHITSVYEMPAGTSVHALQQALVVLASRHESLRLRITSDSSAIALDPPTIDALPLTTLVCDDDVLDAQAQAWAATSDRTAFSLQSETLWRGAVFTSSQRSLVVLTVHHIATDGWSTEILRRELATLLSSTPTLAPLSEQFAEHAAREVARLDSPAGVDLVDGWRQRLASHRRFTPAAQALQSWDYDGGSVVRVVPRAVVDVLHEAARRRGVSLTLLLLSVFTELHQQRDDDDDLLVNTHLYNRHTPAERAMVGYCVNLLTLRPGKRRERFDDTIEAVRHGWLEALDQAVSIDHLVSQLAPSSFASRYMPAKIAFNMLPPSSKRAAALVKRPELEPPPAFLFFEQMLVAATTADGSLWLNLWHNRHVLNDAQAADVVDSFIYRLGDLR
jgi:acyl-CoA synthetase (AMP-forming)/AMP-acid ligase II/acyl carrier protein